MKREDIYYEAMLARDHRFDGKFFVGVKTTGIYCRPICPAKPKRENVEFFHSHLEAEKAGYRPCLRCRPESAPRSAAWIGKTAIVQRAIKVLHRQDILEFDEDKFASLFGVSSRHLRRLFMDEIGKTPKQLSFENRLNLARKLIVETALPITEVVYASGFRSIRRFNDAFLQRFKKSPRELRRSPLTKNSNLVVSLAYRPPFDFQGLINVYRSHRIGQLEWFSDDKMWRVIQFQGKVGKIIISNDEKNSRLLVEIDFPDTAAIHMITSNVRSLFDLDSDPLVIANALEIDSKMKALVKAHSGIRLPSGWDPFEIAVTTILGQLVSVEQGRSLVSALIDKLGVDSGLSHEGKPVKLFPTAEVIASSDLAGIKTTAIRKKTLINFCKALVDGEISLESTQDVDEFVRKVQAISGIGPWTANYMAMKVLRHTDAFPATDLILARALEIHSKDIVLKISPWRGYAAALFWKEYAGKLTKRKKNEKSAVRT